MKIVVDERYQHLSDAVARLPQMMDEGQGEVIYDSRNRVVRFVIDGQALMVKRFKRVNIIQQVVYTFFRKTKAERAFLFAEEFLRRGIDTPPPVAYMEERCYGLFSIGYFVSLEVAGTETSQLLREVQDYPQALAEAVAQQIVTMHNKGILHGDLNLSNLLVTTKSDGSFHFIMIDTNRSHFRDSVPSDEECLNNLIRLTHRRDLYEDLVRCYALLRGWNADSTVSKALSLLDHFENRKLRL